MRRATTISTTATGGRRTGRATAARRLLLGALLGLAGVVAGGLGPVPGAPAQTGGTVTIDFEDYSATRSGTPAAPAITDRYRSSGVVFATPVTALVFDSSSIPPGPLARSGTIAVTSCYAEEFCSNRIDVSLTAAAQRVKVWVGSSDPLAAPADVVIEGRDASGKVLSSGKVTLASSPSPIPVGQALSVSDDTGRLVSVRVEWAEGSHSGLLLDDVTIEPFVPVRRLELDPANVTLTADTLPAQATVKLTNTGNQAVTPSAVTVAESAGDARWAVDAAPCLLLLAPRQSCTLTVRLEAAPDGQVTGRLAVRDSQGVLLGSAPVTADVKAATDTSASDPTSSTDVTEPTESTDVTGSSTTTATDPDTTPGAGGSGPTADLAPTDSTGPAGPDITSDAGSGPIGVGATGTVIGTTAAVGLLVTTGLLRRRRNGRGTTEAASRLAAKPPASRDRTESNRDTPGTVQVRPGSDRLRVKATRGPALTVSARLLIDPDRCRMVRR